MKNKMHAQTENSKKDVKILAAAAGQGDKQSSLKLKEEAEKNKLRKREMKSLTKSLQTAQMSTASMGRFDRKVGKNEPDAPLS